MMAVIFFKSVQQVIVLYTVTTFQGMMPSIDKAAIDKPRFTTDITSGQKEPRDLMASLHLLS